MSDSTTLQPETIIHVTTETESRVWSQGGITDEREESIDQESNDIGMSILQHGTSTRNIHTYFMSLEQRKCCLLLAACKQRFFSVRLVRSDGRDSGIEEGAMMKSSVGNVDTVVCLNAEEFQVFQHTLKCAAFPVLGAPDPPSEATPIPSGALSSFHPKSLCSLLTLYFVLAQTSFSFTVISSGSSSRPMPFPYPVSMAWTLNRPGPSRSKKESMGVLQYDRNMTPLSLNDSGVEEQEDTAMVPAETLCELLRRAFRLTQEKFNQYEEIIASQLERKSPQKRFLDRRYSWDNGGFKKRNEILAEELVRQLIALENNENQYYNPKTFLNRIGYDQWQQRERTNISDLLNKFWHFSLPQLSDRSIKMKSMHKQYRKLLEKLISYESPYRQQNELIAPPPTSPLSSASVRLLKEFGLRYGVGEQYRKIVYLNYLSLNFDPTVWFIHHVMSSLTSVMESMPTKRSCLIIVKEEYSILENSLYLLEAKSSAAISKMKTLYTTKRPLDGVEPLIELLSLTLQAKTYLLLSPKEQLGNKLFKIVQAIFPTMYERHKMVAEDELRHNKWDTQLSPQLLNMMIGHIRDEVTDYKHNYQSAFNKYFNITVEAAQEFYKLLMSDVMELLKQTKQTNVLEINKLMLSLAYRLNQLDQDWAIYITPQMQTWRDLFLNEAQHWVGMLKLDMQKLITQTVSADRYPVCELKWTGTLQSPSHKTERQRTTSKSLTPSLNSAFTSPSSLTSTPNNIRGQHQPSTDQAESKGREYPKPPEFPIQSISEMHFDSATSLLERRPSSDPVNISQSSMLKGSYLGDMARSLGHYDEDYLLSFAHLRHSSSLPNIQSSEKFIEMVPTSFNENRNAPVRKGIQKSSKQEFHRSNSNGSPEISKFMSSKIEKSQNEESDDSGTITDDSCSPEGDFNFPPLQEVISSTPPGGNSENAPITVISEIAGNVAVMRPVVQTVSSAFVPVKPVIEIPPALSTSAFTHIVKPDVRGINDNQTKLSQSKMGIITSKIVKSQTVHSTKSVPFNKTFDNPVSGDHITKTTLKTHASKLRDSEAPHVTINSPHIEDSFTNSLTSNISLPHPAHGCESVLTTLPISSSAVDVIIILQRLVGIGKVLCRTLAPSRAGYESDQSVLTSDEFPSPPVCTKSRQKLYDCFLGAIRGTITVYADNMLCMDLCGTTQSMARRLAGPRLVEYLRTQQASGLVWGCRHDFSETRNCFEYLNKQSALLCDRHEPITREMCVRMNNVCMMLTCLDWYHHCLGNAFGIYGDLSVKQNRKYLQTSFNSTDMLRSEFIVVDSYDYDPANDSSDVMETASQLCPSYKSTSDHQILVTSPIDSDRDHLMAVLRALCRIMAYRLNLFVCDALPVLLMLKNDDIPIDIGLKPITDFLTSYISTINGWLYKDPYVRVLECLWIFIVQDFEIELSKVEKSDDRTQNKAQLLLQALAHLLKFMNNQHETLRRELLLSQADDVSFRLSLYSLPLTQLIAIYRGLTRDIGNSSEVSSTDTQYQSILLIRTRLKHDLQTLRKGFSGTELIAWILDNQHLFHSFDVALSEKGTTFTRQTAIVIAQRFLDWNLIADVEGETVRGRSSPSGSLTEVGYPFMTVDHVDCGLSGLSERPFSRVSNDSTPRTTPKPTLRATLRAFSRQSGFKSTTPGIRGIEKSQIISSERSQRTNDSDRNSKIERSNNEAVSSGKHAGNSGIISKQKTSESSEESESRGNAYGTEENDLLDSFGPGSIDSDLNQGFQHSIPHSQVSHDFDPYYMRETPLSLTSAMSVDSRNAIFFESSDNFYYVCPYIGDEQDPTWSNYELFHLVEECFQKKVTADYILRIIYSRRKNDPKARTFLKSSPVDMIEKIRFGTSQEEIPRCVSS